VARVGRALIVGAAALGILTAGSGTIALAPAPAPLTRRVVTVNLLHGGIFSELSGDDEGSRIGSALRSRISTPTTPRRP
jgi:hypothetical protein